MNYLSHYVVDRQPNNPYYNTGLILPDFAKRWVVSFRTAPDGILSSNQLQLLAGALKHYSSDKLFHASVFFEHYQQVVSQTLKSLPFSAKLTRKWFIAHVLTELLIDRALVRSFPNQVDDFYAALNATENEELTMLLNAFGVSDSGPFLDFFNHFRQVQYIYYYTDNNKFLYSLDRIMMRVGLPEMESDDRQLMLEGILDLEENRLPGGKQWLDELKNVFV